MKSLFVWIGKKALGGIATGVFFLFAVLWLAYALSYPNSPPSGEMAGGKIMSILNNMISWVCPAGQAVVWFEANGGKKCLTLTAPPAPTPAPVPTPTPTPSITSCPGGQALNYPSLNGLNHCDFAWNPTPVWQSANVTLVTGSPTGSLSGYCKTDGTYNYTYVCPNPSTVTCLGWQHTISSVDLSNTCTFLWNPATAGSNAIYTATNGGTLGGTCWAGGVWSFGYTCPSRAPSCYGGSIGAPNTPRSSNAGQYCTFNFPWVLAGNSVSVGDTGGYGGELHGTCTDLGNGTADWRGVGWTCP